MSTASTPRIWNRKQFLIRGGVAAVGLFYSRSFLQATRQGRVAFSTATRRSTVASTPMIAIWPNETGAVVTVLIAAFAFILLFAANAAPLNDAGEKVAKIVAAIQRADYEGDRRAMQRGFDDLHPFLENSELASRIRYWRGFAQWRQAINGFNDGIDLKELEQNLNDAIAEFKAAAVEDPKFIDAKVGTISCLGYLAFMNRQDQTRAKGLVSQIMPLVKEADAIAPNNPRLIWVHGPIFWNTPAERGGGQDKAIANYQRGLEICSTITASNNPIDPSWGKPELMMSLAYSYANKEGPDVAAAERYARGALEIVPYWHYARDILLPQILAAKAKAQ